LNRNPFDCIFDSVRFFAAEREDAVAGWDRGEPGSRDAQRRGVANFSGARINTLDQTQKAGAIESTQD
jgi:hypothetical protein